jgi:hypothetical protein
MREAIKRIVLRMFPELAGGYHLDRYARIIKISDPPPAGVKCDRFRPYFAADIEILTPDGEPVPDFPKFEAVPLPVPAGGNSEGFFLWPRPGTIVTVRWIEGRPDHPVIQHVYPMGLSLPGVPDHMGKWQQKEGVHQTIDPAGNWERKTDGTISDLASEIQETAQGNRSETIGGNSTETVTGSKQTTAAAYLVTASTVVIGAPGGGPSLLPLITSALNDIRSALDIIADHTHPSDNSISPSSSAIHTKATSVGATNTSLLTLQE